MSAVAPLRGPAESVPFQHESFDRRPFATGDESRNLAWLAPLA